MCTFPRIYSNFDCFFFHLYACILHTGGKVIEGNPELKEKMLSRIPLRRLGTRTDIAEAAIFLASNLSSYVTGTVMVVDGGDWMGGRGVMSSML